MDLLLSWCMQLSKMSVESAALNAVTAAVEALAVRV